MNDDARLERIFTDALASSAPSRAPLRLRADIKVAVSRTRSRPRWLALIKEPPMRIHNAVAVGSPPARLAYIVILALMIGILATGAVVAGASLVPSAPTCSPCTIVVAQDGSGDYVTIGEAVAAAQDGDIIRVRAGTYPGAIEVDKDITIRGEGQRNMIVVEIDSDGPKLYDPAAPFAIHLLESNTTLANLTIRGPSSAWALVVSGGAPTLDGIDIFLACCWEGPGHPRDAFHYDSGAAGLMRNVTTDGFARIEDGSSPTIERLSHVRESLLIGGAGTDPVIYSSTLAGVGISDGAQPTITDSYLSGVGIESTGTPVIRDSIIADAGWAIGDLVDDDAGRVDIVASSPLLEGNRIGPGPIGIRVNGGAPTIEGNTIENNAIGLSVMSDSGLTLSGNTFCGNTQDLDVPQSSAVTLDGNDVCEASAAEAAG